MPTGIYIRKKGNNIKIGLSNKGKQAGNKHWNWKGGITSLRKKLYFTNKYKNWRKSIFERDDYTCVFCKKRGVALCVDHIKPWSEYPKLRFELLNGRTLCIECHSKTHSYGKWDYRKHSPRIGKVNSGSFKKGHRGYKSWTGKKFSLEHRRKLRDSHIKYWENKKMVFL